MNKYINITAYDTNKLLNNFKVKNANKNKNIIFIGSCRLASIINYIRLLDVFSNYNIHYIYVVDFNERKVPVNIINKIIQNTEIIVCEKTTSYNYLNTDKQAPYNIFQTYDIPKNCKIVNISNLEFLMFYSDLLVRNKNKNILEIRNQSLERLKNKLLSNKQYNIIELLNKYLFNQKFPLFYTANHPSSVLTLLSFKHLCDNVKIHIPTNKILDNYLTDLRYFSLYGNNTSITYWDKKNYNISFCKNFSNDYCNAGNTHQDQYQMNIEVEKKILVNYI